MALETMPYDPTDYLRTPASIFYFVEAELEMEEPSYWPGTIGILAKARGGFARLSQETGESVEDLQAAADGTAAPERAMMVRLMEAYRPVGEAAGRVA